MRITSNNNPTKDYKALMRLSLFSFIAEITNLVFEIISSILSHTTFAWVDTILSVEATTHALIAFLVTRSLLKDKSEKYNFGVERKEVFFSFICDLLVVFGMLVVLASAINGIINPTAPADSLRMFLILKASNTFWDIVFLIFAVIAAKKAKSRLSDSELRNYINVLASDIVMGIIGVIAFIFRHDAWTAYASPIVSIVLVAAFFIIYVYKIQKSSFELIDVSIPINQQDIIYDIILQHTDIIYRIKEVNCRRLNGNIYCEINLIMKDDVTYFDQKEYLKLITEEINKVITVKDVKLVITKNE